MEPWAIGPGCCSESCGLDRFWRRPRAFLLAFCSFFAISQEAAVGPRSCRGNAVPRCGRQILAVVPSQALEALVCAQRLAVLSAMAKPRLGETPGFARAVGSINTCRACE